MKINITHRLLLYLSKRFANVEELLDNPVFLREAGIGYGKRGVGVRDFLQAAWCFVLIIPLFLIEYLWLVAFVASFFCFFYTLFCGIISYLANGDIVKKAHSWWDSEELVELHLSGLSGYEILWGEFAAGLYRQAFALQIIVPLAVIAWILTLSINPIMFIYPLEIIIFYENSVLYAIILKIGVGIVSIVIIYAISFLLSATIQIILYYKRLSIQSKEPLYSYFIKASFWVVFYYFSISTLSYFVSILSIFIIEFIFVLFYIIGEKDPFEFFAVQSMVSLTIFYFLCWFLLIPVMQHAFQIVYRLFRNRSLIYYRNLICHLADEK